MAVSQMAFKIVKSAVRIRLERGEALDDILNSYVIDDVRKGYYG